MKNINDTLDLIVPVYNEREVIESVFKEWKELLDKNGIRFNFIVCEDGSTDGTSEFLKKIQNKYRFVLNQKSERRGYSRAVIDGILLAKAKYIICTDSDGQFDPEEFMKYWDNRDKADIIVGWRTHRIDPQYRIFLAAIFKKIFDILFPNTVHDPSSPLIRREAIVPYINYLSYLDEGLWWGIIAICIKKHISIYEIPIKNRARSAGDTQLYILKNIPSIAYKNIRGLIRLRLK